MTRDAMFGVFIYDRVLAGWWRSQWKASVRQWVGRCTKDWGRGQVYKCECGWDHCGVLGCCLLCLSLCSSGLQDLLRLKPPVSYKYTTHPIPCHISSTCLWKWNWQRVPERRLLELRRREITQKKTYFIQNTAKASNKKFLYLLAADI